MNNAQDYVTAILAAFDARIAHETLFSKSVDSISAKLKVYRASCDNVALCEVMLASNVDANFINREGKANTRYNVYAVRKVINIARAIAKAEHVNHYTKAILATAMSLAKVESKLTRDDAFAACSADSKMTDAKRSKLIVRTAKIEARSTQATQHSSSLQALVTCNVLVATRNAANKDEYSIADNDSARALCAMIAA